MRIFNFECGPTISVTFALEPGAGGVALVELPPPQAANATVPARTLSSPRNFTQIILENNAVLRTALPA